MAEASPGSVTVVDAAPLSHHPKRDRHLRRLLPNFAVAILAAAILAAVIATIVIVLSLTLARPEREKVIYVIRHGEKIHGDVATGHLGHSSQCLSEKGWARAYNLKSIFGPRPQPPFKTPQAIFSANYATAIDCRDLNGWYRTQQTASALAANTAGGLGIQIDNSTGFMPSLCGMNMTTAAKEGEAEYILGGVARGSQSATYANMSAAWWLSRPDGGTNTCSPFGEGGGDGTCCNRAAADAMKSKLLEDRIDTVLVVWEHFNIGYLSVALGASESELTTCDGTTKALGKCWPSHDYDRVYKFTYTASGDFVRLEQENFQGFDHPDAGPNQASYLGHHELCGAVKPTTYPVTPSTLRFCPNEETSCAAL